MAKKIGESPNEKKYMSCIVHWLTPERAKQLQSEGWIIRPYADGGYSAVKLSDTPLQPGQAAWVGDGCWS